MPRSTTRGPRYLWLLATTSALVMAITPAAIDLHSKGPILKVAKADTSCFVAGTRILMADGTEKPIEQVAVGDLVVGGHGGVNRVTGIERPRLGGRRLYALNNGRAFVTAEHPFLTRSGWRAIDPTATADENSALEVGALLRGDLLAVARFGAETSAHGNLVARHAPEVALDFVVLQRIDSISADPRTELFNLLLNGDHSYFADGYLVHNKDGGDNSGSSGGDNSGEGSDSSGSGEEGESGDEGESTSDSDHGKSRKSGTAAGGFGGLEQLGPDLTASEEAETIERGWQ